MSDESATMTFIQHQLPPLEAGDYVISVQQTLTGPVHAQFPKDAPQPQSFNVQGARFSLSPTLIASHFPPANHTGEFGNCLPHIVLLEPTLPWQRDPDGVSRAARDAPPDVAPWLALVLLDEDDVNGAAFPALQAIQLKDLSPAPQGIFFPSLTLESADDPDATCQVVELATELFNQIAPRLADLPWIAHTRTVAGSTMVRKVQRPTRRNRSLPRPTADGPQPDDGNFAVLLGNRFPKEGRRNQVYLVSLEGYGPFLPGGPSTIDSKTFPSVRLVVLSAWGFTADTLEGRRFADMFEQLNADNTAPTTLRLPTTAAVEARVTSILESGYVPLNHLLRTGDETVSWYRGPFVPNAIPLQAALSPDVVSTSDALLHYDPSTGLLDASHAAAWQVGRSLGLHSKQFSSALYAWREGNLATAAAAMAHRRIREALHIAEKGTGSDRPGLRGDFRLALRDAVKTSVGRLQCGGGSSGAGVASAARLIAPRPWPAAPDAWTDALVALPDDVPPAIASWLGELALCRGIPFNYLVPDPRMLPTESIRFFQVDPNWIANLVEGALSIGRKTGARTLHDRRMRPAVHAAARAHAASARDRLLNVPRRTIAPDDAASVMSGFLLRSSVVQGWPGMEIHAYADAGRTEELTISRLETLAPTVMICLATGSKPIALVDIREPSEGVHFGLDWSGTNPQTDFTKTLRRPDTGVPDTTQVTGTVSADRTLDVAGLATTIQSTTGATRFTAAELGLQMIEGVAQVTFDAATVPPTVPFPAGGSPVAE